MFTAYKPIDPSWFGAVDARAVTASAINWDVAGLYDMVMNVVKTTSPDEGYPEIQKAIAGFESEAKLRVREGLLASLAGPALFYILPAGTILESPRGGFVVVAKLKGAPLFEKTMSALGEFAGGKSKGSLQITPQTREGGRTVQVWTVASLMMLGITPAWSVANDHVVIGSTVELCDLGVKQLVSKGTDGKSLLDAQGYQKIAAGLPKDLVSLTYTDSRVQLTQTMMQIQQFWPMATMVAMQAGVKLPVALPSLTGIAKDLEPSCSYRYFGPDGLHVYYRGPGIEASQATIAGVAVGAAVSLPAMARVREQAKIAASMSNLKQIGLALIMYTKDHEGEWPADLEQVKSYLGGSRILESPRKPKGFEGPSYVYVSGQPKTIDPRGIVVYENPAFCTDRTNVLFADGHVEAMKPEAFRRELKATYERLGKEMPEVKFKGEGEVKPRTPRPARPSKAAQT
jgi:prepilin-type processing-associated H-X9-DG protein